MTRISISPMLRSCALALTLLALAGCATRKDALLPHGNATMLDIWNAYAGAGGTAGEASQELLDARQVLRRPLIDGHRESLIEPAGYTRTAENEITRQFKRLPDPDLVMYVFPHLAGHDPVPVPGYSTVFPFYRGVHYAMPGDRTAPY
jgi:conjugative transfer region lipoprotein (TIGR03751 family)